MKEKLLDALIGNKDIVWSLKYSIFNSDTRHNYTCQIDSNTTVDIDISLDNNLNYNRCASLSIRNEKLIDGVLHIFESDKLLLPKTKSLGQYVFTKFIKPNIKPRAKTQEDVLDDIINAIPNKAEIRDRKISDVLETTEERKRKNWF